MRERIFEITVEYRKSCITSPGSLRSPEDIAIMPYLVQWSEINHDAYCLALLFTYRDFSDGALGLAWVAEPELDLPGGICSKKVLLKDEHEALSFNAALATLLNFGVRIPRKASVITVMHELGHSFGSVVSILHAPSPSPPPPPSAAGR